MRVFTFIAAVLIAFGGAPVPDQSSRPALSVLKPTADDVVTGPTTFAAEVRPPDAAVREVSFFVDGHLACQAAQRPFTCSADAGNESAPRSIRVVARLDGDDRLVETFRSKGRGLVLTGRADAILVTVHVTDSHGRFVHGLDASNFHILEDGEAQEIGSFVTEDAPASVLLALDMSASMTVALADLKDAARAFLQELRPNDSVTLTAFNSRLVVLSPPGAGMPARLAALDQLAPGGMTALYDAIIQATSLTKGQSGRRAIVAFTDGEDDASMASLESVKTTLESSDVVLYLIARGKAAQDRKLGEALTDLAVATGGAAFLGPSMSHLQEHFAKVRDDLANGYLLGYTPKRPLGDGGRRGITVTLTGTDKSHRVQARDGYLAVAR